MKYGVTLRFTDEQLNGPPPLSQEQQERYAAEDEAREQHLRTGLSRAPRELDLIIDLHRDREGQCRGCDEGYHADEAPEWPCSTIELIADTYDPEGV